MQRHMILTLGRSGSNTLVDMVNQNPAVLNYGEVLGEWTVPRQIQSRLKFLSSDETKFLDAFYDRRSVLQFANGYRSFGKIRKGRREDIKRHRDIQSIGVKEFSLNLKRFGLSDYINYRKDLKIIGLVRKDILARAVSSAILDVNGIYSSQVSGNAKQSQRLHMAPEKLITALGDVEEEVRELERMLQSAGAHRVFRLDYETFYSTAEKAVETTRQLFRFLDVPDYIPTIRMSKIGWNDPLCSFENADELRSVISETRFSEWLPCENIRYNTGG